MMAALAEELSEQLRGLCRAEYQELGDYITVQYECPHYDKPAAIVTQRDGIIILSGVIRTPGYVSSYSAHQTTYLLDNYLLDNYELADPDSLRAFILRLAHYAYSQADDLDIPGIPWILTQELSSRS